jgi:nucleoid-associated protein YgaU
MNLKLNCPVCGYQEIEGNICPNCDTDLSLIRTLQELPPQKKSRPFSKIAPLGLAILMLVIGIILGASGSFLWVQPNLYTTTISPPQPVTISPTPKPQITPEKPPKPTTYTVVAGDSLTVIATKFCRKGASWQIIVKANPQLKGRENSLEVGEVLTIPRCQE